jgi:hypothetical protein
MFYRPTIVERAYELARTGTVKNIERLIRQLKREAYEFVDERFDKSPSLRRDLKFLCGHASITKRGNQLLRLVLHR